MKGARDEGSKGEINCVFAAPATNVKPFGGICDLREKNLVDSKSQKIKEAETEVPISYCDLSIASS
jgi:hypothetical protein